ncbi:MAG: DUF1559 domain-containing protein [Fuerstiella sp.]
MTTGPTNPRSGFTLLELMVVIGVIGILAAIIIPAVQSARAAARKTECVNNLRQVGLATLAFESTHGHFPMSIELGREDISGWIMSILPFMDQQVFHDHVLEIQGDFKLGYGLPGWDSIADQLRKISPPGFQCPADSLPSAGTLSYPGNAGTWVPEFGYNGIFREGGDSPESLFKTGPVRASDVIDGLSNTVMVSEWLHGSGDRMPMPDAPGTDDSRRMIWYATVRIGGGADLATLARHCLAIPRNSPARFGYKHNGSIGAPWFEVIPGKSLYYHALTPNKPSCTPWAGGYGSVGGIFTASSAHDGGVNCVFADGHVAFQSDTIDLGVWRDLGSRSDVNQMNFVAR